MKKFLLLAFLLPVLSSAQVNNPTPSTLPCAFQTVGANNGGGTWTNQAVYTCNIAAGYLQAGKGIRVHFSVIHTNNAQTLTTRVSFNGSLTVCNSNTVTTGPYQCIMTLFNNPGVTNAQTGYGEAVQAGGTINTINTFTPAIDTTQAWTITGTVTCNAADTCTPQGFWAELIN
jgi:hypothetical protein